MPDRKSGEVTRLLRLAQCGDAIAGDALLPLVYAELRELAQSCMRAERAQHTLQPTALVHEAWLRLGPGAADCAPTDRRHFLAVAARAMRQVLVDHARAHRADKRGGGREAVPLDEAMATFDESQVDVLALDEALNRLGEKDPQLAQVVELRYITGLTLEETAEVLDLTVKQVRRSWGLARGFLFRELQRGA